MHRLDGRKVKNTFNIEQPANSSSNLWSLMNDGQWKKYEKEAIAANDQDSAQTTQLSIADVTEDLKTADGKDNYD